MEMSPRAGGNRLAELIKIATGSDIILPEVQKAIGECMTQIDTPTYLENYAIYVLHTQQEGVFKEIRIQPEYRANILAEDIYINVGEHVKVFGGANNAIGTLFLRFKSREELEIALLKPEKWCDVIINTER